MSSSGSSSHCPGEEAYHTAEEDHQSYMQGSSVASSTRTTTLDGGSDSVYATANQTPTASPQGIDTFTACLGKLAFFMSISAKHNFEAFLERCCEGVSLRTCFKERSIFMLVDFIKQGKLLTISPEGRLFYARQSIRSCIKLCVVV